MDSGYLDQDNLPAKLYIKITLELIYLPDFKAHFKRHFWSGLWNIVLHMYSKSPHGLIQAKRISTKAIFGKDNQGKRAIEYVTTHENESNSRQAIRDRISALMKTHLDLKFIV